MALVFGALLLVLAAWSRVAPVGPWELALLVALEPAAGLHSDGVRALNTFGNLDVWAVFVFGLAGIALALRRPFVAAVVVATLLSDAATYVIKIAVERDRPERAVLEGLVAGDSFAFPSGHVARAASLTAVLAWVLLPPSVRLPAAVASGLLAGAVMGYGRMALGVHWPTDVLGGILLGLAWFCASALVLAAAGRGQPSAA